MHKHYSLQSLSFISGIAPLPASLDSTLVESHRNTCMDLLAASLVSTSMKLFASSLYAGSISLLSPYSFFIFHFFSLFIFFSFLFFLLCITLIHFMGRRGILTY